jgi:DNA polymerase III delta prime subunit
MADSMKLQFVGRKNYIDQIESYIQKTDKHHIILLEGDGGVGKTCLLQELKRRLESSPDKVNEIIDCDALLSKDAEYLCTQIANQLGKEIYKKWLSEMQELRKDGRDLPQNKYEKKRNALKKFLADAINKKSENQRQIFLIDTIEKLGEPNAQRESWNYIVDLFHQLNNAIFILAGRSLEKDGSPDKDKRVHTSIIREILKKSLNNEVLSCLWLNQLTEAESNLYILKKQETLNFSIRSELIPKINFLANGIPIILELLVEYIYRGITPDWMENDLKVIETQHQHDIQEFIPKLVRHITKIRTPMDRLVLMLSRIYPLDVNDVAALLKLSHDEAKKLFQDAQSYFFVKVLMNSLQISLHDIMRELIDNHVWNTLDPSNSRRKRDSYLAAEHFQRKDEQISQEKKEYEKIDASSNLSDTSEIKLKIAELSQLRESNTMKWLKNSLYADSKLGFETWYTVSQKSTKTKASFVKRLLTIVQNDSANHLTEDQEFKITILESKIINALDNATKTANRAKELEDTVKELEDLQLQSSDPNHESVSTRRANLYNVLGMLNTKLHLYAKALEYQKKCLCLVEINKPSTIPAVANQVGYLYRQLSDIENAEKYYRLALSNAMKIDKPDRILTQVIASIQTNLGYLYGETEDNSVLSDQCFKAAKETLLSIDDVRKIAQTEIASAIIHRNRGEYDKSIELLVSALKRCDSEEDDNKDLCRAYFHLGWTYWFQSEIIDVSISDVSEIIWSEDLLIKAQDALEKSLSIAQKHGLEDELPGIQHQTASVYWHLGFQTKNEILKEKARNLNNEAYVLSNKYNDTRYAIDSLLGNAEFDYDAGIYEKISDYALELQDRFQSYKDSYKLYFGRMLRIEGDVKFREKNYALAFEKYALGIPKILEHGGFGPYSIRQELNLLQKKIEQLPVECYESLTQQLKEQWKTNTTLAKWCSISIHSKQQFIS